MTVFFIVAALLVLAAVLFIVPPLLRREPAHQLGSERRALNISIYQDQMKELGRELASDVITPEQYARSREELERRMLEDVSVPDQPAAAAGEIGRGTVLGVALVAAIIPVLAAGLYMTLGTPAALDPELTAARSTAAVAGAAGAAGEEGHDQIIEMIAMLEQRLAGNPDDPQGWSMLGRSYLWMQRFDLALPALEKAVSLNDGDPRLLVDYADALAMTDGQTLQGRPIELITRALTLDPNNEKGLWLAGTAAYEQGEYAQALQYWQRLQRLVPPGSDAARAMEGNIAEVQSLLSGQSPAPAPAQQQGGNAAAVAGAEVRGRVTVDPALAGRIQPGDTLFLFARASSGPRLPLAVMRVQASDLPLEYVLDDSMAMDPSMSLSKFPEVVVVARVSRSGGAMVQSGDLQGTSAVVRTGDAGRVDVLIDEVVP
jgi:cytochrome c-type biogenesis protein CcmH